MRGGGSAIVELLLVAANIPFERVDLEWEDLGLVSATLRDLNPFGKIARGSSRIRRCSPSRRR
jgi:hypothetical protein